MSIMYESNGLIIIIIYIFPVIADILVCGTILILSVRKHYTLPNILNAFLFYMQVSVFSEHDRIIDYYDYY